MIAIKPLIADGPKVIEFASSDGSCRHLTERQANAAFMSQRLKAMSNPERLLMMCRMDEGEVSVNELVVLIGLKQSAVSQHLGLLRA